LLNGRFVFFTCALASVGCEVENDDLFALCKHEFQNTQLTELGEIHQMVLENVFIVPFVTLFEVGLNLLDCVIFTYETLLTTVDERIHAYQHDSISNLRESIAQKT